MTFCEILDREDIMHRCSFRQIDLMQIDNHMHMIAYNYIYYMFIILKYIIIIYMQSYNI